MASIFPSIPLIPKPPGFSLPAELEGSPEKILPFSPGNFRLWVTFSSFFYRRTDPREHDETKDSNTRPDWNLLSLPEDG
jgi:hypothetical protein